MLQLSRKRMELTICSAQLTAFCEQTSYRTGLISVSKWTLCDHCAEARGGFAAREQQIGAQHISFSACAACTAESEQRPIASMAPQGLYWSAAAAA